MTAPSDCGAGATVKLVSHEPLDGVFEVQVGEQIVSLAAEGLRGLWGEPVSDDKVTR
jgi:hypothetical protein